ncbi:MAG: MoxR family ATPase [Planctomycetaceae bacterium]|nr:MoxR family ATPase [Planctomycetaceae bacterium]
MSDRPTPRSSLSLNLNDPVSAVGEVRRAVDRLRTEVHKAIVGQDEVVEQALLAILCGGHAIVEGVPGLAKTLLVSSLAKTLGLQFSRIQFTPDLMPSDMTGTEVIQEDKATGSRTLRFVKGPIFANIVLADEINRTPPKTQAALLEAMQERQVTAGGVQYALPAPFFVLATQNPIEQEGTYPLPEAQLDRFMLNIRVNYPTEAEEIEIVTRTTSSGLSQPECVLTADDILRIQALVRQMPVAEHVVRYAIRIVRATRVREEGQALKVCRDYLAWGAGPRASQFLILAAKAKALLEGATHVTPDHVRAIAFPTMRHRIVTNFNAEADGIKPDDVVRLILEAVPADGSASVLDPVAR